MPVQQPATEPAGNLTAGWWLPVRANRLYGRDGVGEKSAFLAREANGRGRLTKIDGKLRMNDSARKHHPQRVIECVRTGRRISSGK